jgi:hypothetical protein
MDPNLVSLLQSMHERISSLETRANTSRTAVILMEKACHAWMDVQRMMGASDETMRIHVQTAVQKALEKVQSTEGLQDSIRQAKLPEFFAAVMKTDPSRRKSLEMIRGWILELMA